MSWRDIQLAKGEPVLMEQRHDSVAAGRHPRVRPFITGLGSLLDLWPVVDYEDVGAHKADDIMRRSTKRVSAACWTAFREATGPLPPPLMLKQYDDVVPGGAERVVRMAEKAADHEIEFGRTALAAAISNTKQGRRLGFVVVLAVLACSMIALYAGYESFATTLGGSTVISLAAIFALGRLPGWVKAFGRKSE